MASLDQLRPGGSTINVQCASPASRPYTNLAEWTARALACCILNGYAGGRDDLDNTKSIPRATSHNDLRILLGLKAEANAIVPLDQMLAHLPLTRLRAQHQHLLNEALKTIQSHLYAEPPPAWLGLGCAVKVKVNLDDAGHDAVDYNFRTRYPACKVLVAIVDFTSPSTLRDSGRVTASRITSARWTTMYSIAIALAMLASYFELRR
ncbi:hypothetical protein GGG16DRAFT_117587 [Schizophyllum commune]